MENRRRKYKGASKELLLEELEKGESLENVEKYREKTFVEIVGKEQRVIEGEEALVEILRNLRYLFGRLLEDRARSVEKTEYHIDELRSRLVLE